MKFAALALTVALSTAASAAPSTYNLSKTVSLGVPDRWDYVVYDNQTDRVMVAHGDRLAVINPVTATLVGEVRGVSGGTHGSAVSLRTGQGFTDDGRGGKAVAFDLHTLKVNREIAANVGADAIALDPVTGHLFVIEGDPGTITVIDPASDAPIATIKTLDKLEYAVSDGRGSIYVAGNGSGAVLKVDARTNTVTGRWPTAGCVGPHGIAVDTAAHRAFMGCVNSVMMVVDTSTGKTVAKLPIGRGSDAVAFDPVRKRVFSSNGRDGTISAYQQVSPDQYAPLPTIQTTVSARTMDLDPKSGRLFVAGADTLPNAAPDGRPIVKPGTVRLMIFEPRG